MRPRLLCATVAAVFSSFVPATYGDTLQIVPTTTLSAETANNTSAAEGFATQSNGNIAASNISKVPTQSLLYPGATAPVYAHFMGWFGPSNHMNVGYTSSDPAQVARQVSDALSRSISVFMEDWYGPNNAMPNNTMLALKTESESRSGQFWFGVDYDGGALTKCHNTTGCDMTQQAIGDLTYAYNTFETSPAYLRINGRPVVMFFDPDRYGTLNWSLIASSVPGNPLFIFRNSGGFTHAATSGGYAWLSIDTTNPNNWAQSYLDNFYATDLKYPAEYGFSANFKGFNDTLASWSKNRIMNQNCGQTWLNTFSEMNRYFTAGTQIAGVELVTWNDYEEGSEIESGIDNCVGLAASLSGSQLSWAISGGSESTIDHYTVFVSTDGQNLMSLGDVASGQHSFDLSQAKLAPATYTLYLKAFGRPSITNKMSAAVSYTVSDVAPTADLLLTPASGSAPLSVTASTAASTVVYGSIASSNIDFGDGSAPAAGPVATHTYNFAGAYTVTATVTDSYGTSATAAQAVSVINQSPLAQLSVTPVSGIVPITVSASTAASTDPDGSVASSVINFGDGAVVSGPGASHTYNSAGTYTVTATVYDNLGASSVATATVTASPDIPPTVALAVTPTSGIAPVTVTASTAGSAAPNGSIASTSINFGDGTTANSASASHTYSTAGTYTITASVTDNIGDTSSKTATMTVAADVPPIVALAVTPTSGIAPVAVTASTAGSTAPNGSIVSTSINFGDGASASSASATHTYSATGTYTVTATVTDNIGDTSSKTASVTVGTAGVTVASPIPGAALNANVHVVASAASGNGITHMRIYLDYNSAYSIWASTLDTYIAVASGSHNLTVQAWDNAGTIFKNTQTINVIDQPPVAILSVTPASGNAPLSVTASTAGSSDPDGSITSSSIDFGDGTVVNALSAGHTYTTAGIYTVTAKLTDDSGATSSATRTVTAAGVAVSSPAPGATVSSPIHFVASAFSTHTITTMRIYVDSTSAYLTNASQLDTYVNMKPGTRHVTVQAWDASGALFKNSFTITVH